MNEDHVAFHEIVTLLGWKDSSSRGPIVTIGLASRAALEHFDTATRRKGKKAGQRYHAVLAPAGDPPVSFYAAWPRTDPTDETCSIELWFAGANWAHQDGARVVFTVDEGGFEFFKSLIAKDEKHGTPAVFWLTLVQVDEDETPINQRKADIVEKAAEPEKLKGGPRSKQVAMLCQDRVFRFYVTHTVPLNSEADFAAADAYVKRVCGISSKVELDHNDATWETFIAKVRRPFLEWAHAAKIA